MKDKDNLVIITHEQHKEAHRGFGEGSISLFRDEQISEIPQKVLVNKDHWDSLQADALIGTAFKKAHPKLMCDGQYNEEDCALCELVEPCKLIGSAQLK